MALTREILLFAVLLSIYPDPYIHPIRGVGEMHANMKVKFYYKILLLKFLKTKKNYRKLTSPFS